MSTRKTIQINPQLFNIKRNKTEKKRPKKEKPLVKSNSLKRELMKRIKTHADKVDKKASMINNSDLEFSNDFDKHMNYLNNLSKDTKTQNRKNRKTRRSINSQPTPQEPPAAFLDLPPELNDNALTININPNEQNIKIKAPFQPEPPYGCLKGGDKPTFKDWKRKTQKSVNYNDNIMIDTDEMETTDTSNDMSNSIDKFVENRKQNETEKKEPTTLNNLKINPFLNIQSEREKKLENIKDKFKKKVEHNEINSIVQKTKSKNEPRKFKYNKTVKRTYGKNKGKISVCIKDAQTRKNVIEEQVELRKKPISEIKEYLKEKYLLKSGSHAPNEILRKIYEDAHLAGDIINKNEESLLHNYINNDM
tara:strand:- start:11591 stop:12679 length:1089 start_codon:yes stop_codon:yes gene_type:complete